MNSERLNKNDVVLYTSSGGESEVGVVSQVGVSSSFVFFHVGDTSARVSNSDLSKIDNGKELKAILNKHL